MIRYFFGDDIHTARGRIAALAHKENAALRFLDKDDVEEEPLESLLDCSHTLFGKTIIVLRDVSSFPEHVRNELLALVEASSVSADVIMWDRVLPDARLSFTKKMKNNAVCEQFLQPKDHHSQEETSAFPLLQAIVAKRQQDAVRMVAALIAGGSSERFILSMLAYQFRLFLAVRIGRERGADVSTIHRATTFHPVAIQKAMPHASRMSLPAIEDALVRIGITEKTINASSMDPRSMVTMLVMALCK